MSSDFTVRDVTTFGVRTDVLEVGSGPPLVFLHGGAGPGAVSTEYLSRLGRHFRVVAPYHPGFGRSDRPPNFRDVGDLAYFYLDLLPQLGLQDIVLAGASFGGWLACEIAIRSCAALSRLVLIDPLGLKAGGREERDYVDFFLLNAVDRAALEFEQAEFRRVDFTGKTDDDLAVLARGREAEAHYGWKPFMHNPQLGSWLHRIEVPTLVLRGAEDRVVRPENHARFAELIPHAEFATIEAAGHHPHIDQPAQLVERIVSFVA